MTPKEIKAARKQTAEELFIRLARADIEIKVLEAVVEAAGEIEVAYFNRKAWGSWEIGPLQRALKAWRELKSPEAK